MNACPTVQINIIIIFVGQSFLIGLWKEPNKTYRGMAKDLKITRRHLPHWTIDDVTYFVTFRSLVELTPAERTITFEHVLFGNRIFYLLIAFIVMPVTFIFYSIQKKVSILNAL